MRSNVDAGLTAAQSSDYDTSSPDPIWESIRQLLGSEDWSTVRQGVELAEAMGPEWLGRFTAGVSIDSSGRVNPSDAWIRRTGIKGVSVDNAALLALEKSVDSPLSQVEKLYFEDQDHLTDIAPLAQALSLMELTFSSCERLENMGPLSALSQLRRLTVTSCGTRLGLPSFGPNSCLERLSLSNVDSPDLEAFRGLSCLKSLRLEGARSLKDLSALAGCSNLEQVVLHGCQTLTDLGPLAELSQVRTLSIEGAIGHDGLDGVCKGLTQLRSLALVNLGGTVDLTPLAQLSTTLVALDLEQTNSVGWQALLDLDHLEELRLPAQVTFTQPTSRRRSGDFSAAISTLLGLEGQTRHFEGAEVASARAAAAVVAVLLDPNTYPVWHGVEAYLERALVVGGPKFSRRLLKGIRIPSNLAGERAADPDSLRQVAEQIFERSPIGMLLLERQMYPRWIGSLAEYLLQRAVR